MIYQETQRETFKASDTRVRKKRNTVQGQIKDVIGASITSPLEVTVSPISMANAK